MIFFFHFCFGFLSQILAALLEASVFWLLHTTAACSIMLQLGLSKTFTNKAGQFSKGDFKLCKAILVRKLNLFSFTLN